MKKRRGVSEIKNLCSGPAKLVIAMGISKEDNGKSLLNGNLRIVSCDEAKEICSGKRIGISKGKELKYRFYIKKNIFVSRK